MGHKIWSTPYTRCCENEVFFGLKLNRIWLHKSYAKYQYLDDEIDIQRLRGLLKITRIIDGDLDWNEIYRVLEKTDELIDALSALMYTLDELIKSDVILASSVLSSIKFGSTGDAQIKIDFGIAEILRLITEKLQFWKLEKQRYRFERTDRTP